MALNINNSFITNIITRTQDNFTRVAEKIGSGLRINHASDDAAGFAISERFTTQLSGFSQAARNTNDAISLAQVAGADLNSVSENVQRIRELALQAANGTLNDSDREAINTEARQLREQVNDVIQRSNFNGKFILSNNGAPDNGAPTQHSIGIQVGSNEGDQVELNIPDLEKSIDDSKFNSVDLSTAQGAKEALSAIDQFENDVLTAASDFGALTNRFRSTVEQLGSSEVTAQASRSRIRDADFARETSELVRLQIQQEVGIAVQTQANQQGALVLRLLS